MGDRDSGRVIARSVTGVVVAWALVGAGAHAASAGQPAPRTERISVAADGTQGDAESGDAAVSADGRYAAFTSNATALVPGDTNDRQDVFVRDLKSGGLERVSVAGDGAQANGHSFSPGLSADGRYVVFSSGADNLDPDHAGQLGGIFVHDRKDGTTRLVSISASGEPVSGGYTVAPAISDDGRHIAYMSYRSENGEGDDTMDSAVYVRDREAGTTERVSKLVSDPPSRYGISGVDLSADGRHVAYSMHQNKPGLLSQAFVHDRRTGRTEQVNVSADGASHPDISALSLSGDGRRAVFSARSAQYVAGDTNDALDVFVRDLRTDTTTRVSVAPDGGDAKGNSMSGVISRDGRHVAFGSWSSDLVAEATPRGPVFVRDLRRGVTERVSVPESGGEGDAMVLGTPAVSDGGRVVVFPSDATDMVPSDTNGQRDMFVRHLR